MFSAIVFTAALVAAVQAVTVNTPPSLVQCQPAQLTWGEGTAPYYVSIIPGGQPSAAALESFATQSGTSYTWMVDLAAGQSVTVKVTDSTGSTNYSDQVTIQAGSDTSCSNSSSGSSSTAAAAAAATTSASSSSAAAATSSASRTALSAASSSASSAASKVSSSASSAIANAANSASASTSNTGAASSSVKAGLGMLVGGVVLALAA